jgi:hypothetical protein
MFIAKSQRSVVIRLGAAVAGVALVLALSVVGATGAFGYGSTPPPSSPHPTPASTRPTPQSTRPGHANQAGQSGQDGAQVGAVRGAAVTQQTNVSGSSLPFTGADVAELVVFALALVLVGAAARRAGRRRQQQTRG